VATLPRTLEPANMNPLASDLFRTAHALLARGDRLEATNCLRAVLRLDPASLHAHNLIEAHRLDGNFTDAFGIDAAISPDDDIFRFFAGHPSSTNPIRDYLSDGWRTMVELTSLLDAVGRPLGRCRSFLEFASGFGRFTRHLVKALPPGSLGVSDVVPGSVDFLRQRHGVEGFYSTHVPGDLVVPKKYSTIFVLSLFSHLPRETWALWLQSLYEALDVDGVLVFTTHGAKCARLLGVQIPADGFQFVASSESTVLSKDEYGTAFTSAEYVCDVIRSRLTGAVIHEFPEKFWGNQDAYAVVKTK